MGEHQERPKAFQRYRHFKGKDYQVLTIARKEDTGEELVIYQQLYGDYEVFARSLEQFTSEVDHVKYPDVKTKWRFTLIADPENERPQTIENYDRSARSDKSETYTVEEPVEKPAAQVRDYTEGSEDNDRGAGESAAEQFSNHQDEQSASQPAVQFKDHPAETYNTTEHYTDYSAQQNEPEAAEKPDTDEDDVQLAPGEENAHLDPLVEQFLDARTVEEKIGILIQLRPRITNEMIDTMALASGVEVGEGTLDERFDDLRDCLTTIDKYELERSRLRD